MPSSISDSTYQQAVEHLRRVRLRHGHTARLPLPCASPLRRRYVRMWSAISVFWAVWLVVLLCLGLHLRAALAGPSSSATPALQPWSPLEATLRDHLLRGLTLIPVARLFALAGTAEVAAWSPNGRYLAVGYSAGSLLIWDVERWRLVSWAWHAHRRFVNALAWSPDGRMLLSAAPDGRVVLWRASAEGPLLPLWAQQTIPHPPHVPAVAISPPGNQWAIADGLHSVVIWAMAPLSVPGDGRLSIDPRVSTHIQHRLHVAGHTTALVWSADGTHLAVGTLEGQVLVWRIRHAWQPVARAIGSPVYALAWSPTGDTLAVGGADGAVRLLAGSSLHPRTLLLAPFHRTPVPRVPDYGRPVPAHAHAPGQPQVAAGGAINTLAWSASGDVLAVTATGVPLRLWQPSRGIVIAAYLDNWDMNAVAWRADGRLVAVAADDGRVRLLRVSAPAAGLTHGLCRVGLTRWCTSLLGRPPGEPINRDAPLSYMSR